MLLQSRLTFDIVLVPYLWLKLGLGEVDVTLLVVGRRSPAGVLLRCGHVESVRLVLLRCRTSPR